MRRPYSIFSRPRLSGRHAVLAVVGWIGWLLFVLLGNG